MKRCQEKTGPLVSLYSYQNEGAEWLAARKFGLLADEMGIGKSAQAISACDRVGAENILVVCRAVARENWRLEFKKFSIFERAFRIVYDHQGVDDTFYGVTICSYETLLSVLGRSDCIYDCIIVDESHYVKEPGAKRTRTVLGKAGAIHRGRKAYLLTGTPTPNHAGELWTTLYTFGRTRLNYDGFVERYCTTRLTSYGRQITGTKTDQDSIAELRTMLADICLRRTKEDVNLMLPPIIYGQVVVKPGKVNLIECVSFRKYVVPIDFTKDLEKKLEEELGVMHGIVQGGFTLEAMKALEANAKSIMTLRRYNSMQKVEPVVDLVSEELTSGAYKKIVIFCIHRDTIVTLQERLAKKFGAVLVFGGSKPSRVIDRIASFQDANSKCRVFIAQIQTAGTSLTLTQADQVLFVDQSFVPGDNQQAAARCHRIGQTRPVTVRFVSLADSIDQHLSALLKRKTEELGILTDGALGKRKEKTVLRKSTTINDVL